MAIGTIVHKNMQDLWVQQIAGASSRGPMVLITHCEQETRIAGFVTQGANRFVDLNPKWWDNQKGLYFERLRGIACGHFITSDTVRLALLSFI
jgi:hypothetical protein